MKNIGFYGNCQARVLSYLIQKSQYVQSNFRIIELKQVQKIRDEDLDTLIGSIQKLDILVYQKVKGNSKQSTNNLLKYTKSSCQKICIPSCYFEGYNPELTKIKINNYPVNNPFTGQLHDIFILSNYLKLNNNDNKTIKIDDVFYDLSLYDRLFLDNFFQWTVKQLRDREEKNKVDIKISPYIINNYKKERLFVDTNHPCPSLYLYIFQEIFNLLQIDVDFEREFTLEDLNEAEHGHGHQYAIYPSVFKHLNLKFNIDNTYQFNNTIFNRKQITENLFSFYETLDYNMLFQSLIMNDRYILLKDYLNSSSRGNLISCTIINNDFKMKLLEKAGFFSENISNIRIIARDCYLNKQYSEAKKYYKYLIAFDTDNPDNYIDLARILKDEGAIYEAIGSYQQAIKIKNQLSPYIYKELGDLLSQLNSSLKDAINIYQQVLKYKSDWNTGFYLKLANLLIKDGQLDLAIYYCQTGLALNPNSFNLYLSMGNALYKKKKWNEAIECYRKVIKIKPNCHNAYKRLGDLLKNNSKYDLAIEYYKKALELKPKAFYIYRFLGDVFTEQGKKAEAQSCYQKSGL